MWLLVSSPFNAKSFRSKSGVPVDRKQRVLLKIVSVEERRMRRRKKRALWITCEARETTYVNFLRIVFCITLYTQEHQVTANYHSNRFTDSNPFKFEEGSVKRHTLY